MLKSPTRLMRIPLQIRPGSPTSYSQQNFDWDRTRIDFIPVRSNWIMYDGPSQGAMENSAYNKLDARPRTKLERLNDAKKHLETKLSEVNAAIEALEANPTLTNIIDLLEKVGV